MNPPLPPMPGTEAKIALMRARAAKRQLLFQPGDPQLDDRFGYTPSHLGNWLAVVRGVLRQNHDGYEQVECKPIAEVKSLGEPPEKKTLPPPTVLRPKNRRKPKKHYLTHWLICLPDGRVFPACEYTRSEARARVKQLLRLERLPLGTRIKKRES